MSRKEKKDYVSDALFLLLEDFPDDDNVAEFVALGNRELTRTQTQKILFVLSSQKVYIKSLFLSVLLFLNFSWVPYIPSLRENETYTTEKKMI